MPRLILALLAWFAAGTTAWAFEAVMVDGAAVVWPLRSDSPTLQAQIVVRNDSAELRRVAKGARLIPEGGGQGVAVQWAAAPALQNDVLPAGAQTTYTLTATLPDSGRYSVALTGFRPIPGGGEAEAWSITVAIERVAAPLSATSAVLTTNPLAVTLGAASPGPVTVSLRNTSATPIEFGAPVVFAARVERGDAQWALSSNPPPRVSAGNCRSPLPAGASCGLALDPGPLPDAGEYSISVGLAGTAGGWIETIQVVKARWPWSIAFAAVVAGVILGSLLDVWRKRSRPAAQALLALRREAERLQTLSPSVMTDLELLRRLGALLQELVAAQARVRDLGVDKAEIARLSARVQQLVQVAGPWHVFARQPQDVQRFLAARWDPVVRALDAGWSETPDAAAFEGLLRGIGFDLSALPKLGEQLAEAAAVEAALHGLAAAEADAAASRALADQIRTGINTIGLRTPLKAEGDSTGGRLSDAREAAARWEDNARQRARTSQAALVGVLEAAGTGPASALLPEVRNLALTEASTVVASLDVVAGAWAKWAAVRDASSEDVTEVLAQAFTAPVPEAAGNSHLQRLLELSQGEPDAYVVLPPATLSAQQMAGWIRRADLLVSLVVAVLAGIGGVAALWAPDPTWGGLSSLLTAFLAGTAARVVVGSAS